MSATPASLGSSAPTLRLGVVGLGKLSKAIVSGIRRQAAGVAGLGTLTATTRTPESAARATAELGMPCHTDNERLLRESDLVMLSVKPYQIDDVLKAIAPFVEPRHVFVSVIAGVTIERIQRGLGRPSPVVRTMPNTPAFVGAGVTGLATSPQVPAATLDLVLRLFGAVGLAELVDEESLDAVTGLSGSGPAYVFAFIRDLAKGGEKAGLPPEQALRLAAETVRGAALLLRESGQDPETLIRNVATPGGCTVEGLQVLHERGVSGAVEDAVLASARRSRELRS